MSVETQKRSIAKTLSWRVVATLITAVVTYVVTSEWKVAASVGLADTLIKLGAYYLHERSWARIEWGRSKLRDYQI